MNILVKRAVLVLIVLLEILTVVVLCIFIVRQLQQRANSVKYAARLPADMYPKVKSDRFLHFYEPEAGATINDHPDWLGHRVAYSINEDSLHERDDYPVMKPVDHFRIMTLGDSFTYGLFVNTYENYPERLEDYLNIRCGAERWHEVINLGVPAYDVGYSAERFRLRGQKYEPDLIIWFMNPFTFEIDADRKVALENEYLQKVSVAEHWRVRNGKPEYYPGFLAWQQLGEEADTGQTIVQQAQYFREFLVTYRGPLLIVVNQQELWHPHAISVLEESLGSRERYWVYRMDPLEPGVSLLADGHPNVIGHDRIATNILAYLTRQGFLTCGQDTP